MEELDVIENFIEENKKQDSRYFSDDKAVAGRTFDSVLRGIQDTKTVSIQEVILDINDFIEKRKELDREIFEDLENIDIEINNIMNQLPPLTQTNQPAELVKAREELRKMKMQAKILKVQEKLNSWRDISALKRELRGYIRELTEKKGRNNLIDNILEG
jgi:GTP-binding protein EngB required for normal cell division